MGVGTCIEDEGIYAGILALIEPIDKGPLVVRLEVFSFCIIFCMCIDNLVSLWKFIHREFGLTCEINNE